MITLANNEQKKGPFGYAFLVRIVISIGTLGLGGAEKQAVWLANQLSKKHEVTLLTFYGGSRESDLESSVRHVVIIPQHSQVEQPFQNSTTDAESEKDNSPPTGKLSFKKRILVRKMHMIENFSIKAKEAKQLSKSEGFNNLSWVAKFKHISLSISYTLATRVFQFLRSLKHTKLLIINRLGISSFKNKYQTKFRNFRYSVSVFVRFHRELKVLNPNIVITFLYHDTLMVGGASLLLKKRPILIVGRRSPIGYIDKTRPFLEKIILRLIYFASHAAISNSVENIESGLRDGISRRKFAVIPNFLDNSHPQKVFPAKQNRPLKLVYIGNFIWYKNQEKFIRGLASIEENRHRFHITFIGDGPLREQLEELASIVKIDAEFLGSVRNPSALMKEFDALILTSLYEGSSNALLEALSCGMPALTGDLLSTRELLNQGAPIVLCDAEDISAIRNSLIRLENDFANLVSISTDFARQLLDKHDSTRIITLWEEKIQFLSSNK